MVEDVYGRLRRLSEAWNGIMRIWQGVFGCCVCVMARHLGG